jgi:MFS family permease
MTASRTDQQPTAALEHNLRWLSAWWVLRWSFLGESVWVIYLIEVRGLTLGQVLLFEAAFQAVTLLAQVPTGVLADRYGRRPMLIGASLSWAVAFVAFGLAESFAALFGSYLWFALGMALMSGADDAMLFDTLRALGRGEEFARRSGRLTGLATATSAGFALAGGLLARWTPLAWLMVASGGIALTAALLAWPVREPPREVQPRSFTATGRSALRRVWTRPAMRWAIIVVALAQLAVEVSFVVAQPVLMAAGAPVWSLGGFLAVILLGSTAGGWWAGAIGRRLGFAAALGLLAPLAVLAVAGAAAERLWLFPLMLAAPFSWNVLYPLLSDYLARRVPDDERATTLSVSQSGAQIGGIIATVTLGIAVDRGGTQPALAASAVVLLALVMAAYARWRRAGDHDIEPPLDGRYDQPSRHEETDEQR